MLTTGVVVLVNEEVDSTRLLSRLHRFGVDVLRASNLEEIFTKLNEALRTLMARLITLAVKDGELPAIKAQLDEQGIPFVEAGCSRGNHCVFRAIREELTEIIHAMEAEDESRLAYGY